MDLKKAAKRARKFLDRYRITHGKKFRLSDMDPGDSGKLGAENKPQAKAMLKEGVAALSQLQEMLYAQDRWAVLLIFQAMDAAGKDSAIKHVMSGVNPQGCQVFSFKTPSNEELDHDFLWRCFKRLPERGRIGIFNRSYYEETLIVRVHPEHLSRQKIPRKLMTKEIWENRFEDIRNFEQYLARNGIAICKFFLNVSNREQCKRFLERIDDPDKNWKFSPADVQERTSWKKYMEAYEDMIRHTATKHAPWYVVPADNKWFTQLVVASAVIDTLYSLDLKFPKLPKTMRRELLTAKKSLLTKKR